MRYDASMWTHPSRTLEIKTEPVAPAKEDLDESQEEET
jgi:hypothetical protein